MPVSEAKLAANRRNAQLSTGPRTPEGKARVRLNALKHGMTGRGVVLLPTDIEEVGRRTEGMMGDFAPRTETGRFLVRRLALISVRVERCSMNEFAAVADRVARAAEVFDEERRGEVDHALSWLSQEPATHIRKLRSSPEGIDALIACLLDLKQELTLPDAFRWDEKYGEHLSELMGQRHFVVPVSRVRAVSEAIRGNFQNLPPVDGEGLGLQDRKRWARQEMGLMIDEEIDELRRLREAIDAEAIEEARVLAPDLALFDPSKEATLARRYEAAAERAFFRTLRQIGEVEAAGAGPRESIGEVPDSVALNGIIDRESEIEPRPSQPQGSKPRYFANQPPADPLRAAEIRIEAALRSIDAGGLYKDR